MNFTVDRDLLIDVLTGIQGVAERRHTMPVLSHALMTIGGGNLTVVSSDLEIVVRCLQPVTAGEPGSIALPARKLLDIAKVLPKESAVTVAGKEGNYVEISSGRSHFRLAGLPSQEFPEMPEKPSGKTVSIDGDTFRKLSERVVPFASSDETRYNLAGILLEQTETESGPMLRMVATDGHRLAMADGEVGNIGELLASRKILVPKKGILEIRKLAESGPGSIELSASEKFLFAAKGDTEIWVRLLDADFPDYRQVIPKENLLTATVSPGRLCRGAAPRLRHGARQGAQREALLLREATGSFLHQPGPGRGQGPSGVGVRRPRDEDRIQWKVPAGRRIGRFGGEDGPAVEG